MTLLLVGPFASLPRPDDINNTLNMLPHKPPVSRSDAFVSTLSSVAVPQRRIQEPVVAR